MSTALKIFVPITTREDWLERASLLIAERVFLPQGFKVPRTRVSIGFTGSKSGKKTLGACWAPSASDDNVAQIYITPTQSDSGDVLAVLVHELVHATVGNDKGHGSVFKQCALSVGLEGKMRSTKASSALKERLNAITTELGDIPHAKLNLSMKPTKTQSTRLLKAKCLATDYSVRVTRKWIEEVGMPICPCCQESMGLEETEK